MGSNKCIRSIIGRLGSCTRCEHFSNLRCNATDDEIKKINLQNPMDKE